MAHDAAAAVLAALEQGAEEHIEASRPHKTKVSYANDWNLWTEFHGWLAERTGHQLPLTAVTKGTMVGFTVWLDEVKEAAPNSIDRRITGVTVTARAQGAVVPKEATLAARRLVKQYRNDPKRMARGRGKAAPVTPADLRRMNTADLTVAPRPTARRQRTRAVPELARLRDRSLNTLRFAVAGRNEEMSELDDPFITLVAEGLEVHVPSVKGRPPRDVVVAYGEHVDTCPVRCWLAWQAAKLAAGADPNGPAYLPVDQWGNLGTARLSPTAAAAPSPGPPSTPDWRPASPATPGGAAWSPPAARRASAPRSCAPRAAGPPGPRCSGSTSTRARSGRTPPPKASVCSAVGGPPPEQHRSPGPSRSGAPSCV